MRIIAVDQTDGVLRVAYRWANSVFEQPRLLIDGAALPLSDLRRVLERDHFGGPISAPEYLVVALINNQSDLAAVQAAFTSLEVIGIKPDSQQLVDLAQWLDSADRPADRVLAVTYWTAKPLAFSELLDHFERGFLHWESYANIPDTVRTDFYGLRDSMRAVLIGRSAQALRQSYQYLTGEALRVPVIPDKSIVAESHFQGVPLTIIDSRTIESLDSLSGPIKEPSLIILAVASDPGLGAADLAILQSGRPAVAAVVNTHHESTDYAEMYAYLRVALVDSAIVIEAPQIEATVHDQLGALIGAKLLQWLSSYFTASDGSEVNNFPGDLRRDLQRARRIIRLITGQ